VDRDDFAVWIAFDHVDALEGDVFAVAASTAAGPLYGGAVTCNEDVIFGEADGLEERENSGEKLAESFVSEEWGCADGVVAFGVRREGVDPAVDVHRAEGGEVFRYGLFAGGDWHWRIVCLGRRFGSVVWLNVS
jgi:hypothetical protein